MKLPFTEKFLWDLYNIFYDDPDDIPRNSFPKNLFEYLHPEYCQLIEKYKAKKDKQRFQKLIHYLKKKGWIESKKIKSKEAMLITPKGQEKILKIISKINLSGLKKRKDGKWQMVMYDIPKEKERKRLCFRRELKMLGYIMIQKSIWVSPYNVFEETKDLVEDYEFQDYVRVLLVQEMEIG